MVFTRIIILVALVLPCLAQDATSDADDAARHPRTAYFTVGDYQDLLYTPLDSEASITAAFDVMHRLYNIKRVWWRGGQDEVWGKQFVIREQSRRYQRLWDWWMDEQYRVVNTNKIAVKAGHDRGIEVWMAYGLFDNGSPADVGFGGFPYAAEDKIRVEHPEWAPVNKYGTWRQGGPIEFAYPEARKAMVDYLAKYVIEGGYDGIAFLTYVENYSMRYEDEFGYSQPIVDEFKRRHGVDIRTEKFDRDAWAKLRGEYLTQFMRELHSALAKQGRKIAISPDGKQPNLPCLWNVEGGVRTVGRLWMDIEAWAKEGIIDEVSPYYPNTDESLTAVQKACEGTKVSVSAWGRTGGALPAGFGRIMTIGNELESGFDWSHKVDFPTEVVPPQPESSFKSDDVYARRKILTAIAKGKQQAKASDVIPLLKDSDVYVRRGALRALSVINDPSSISAIEQALQDPENSVRWLSAVALGELHSPTCVKQLLDEVARDNSTYQFNFVAVPSVLQQLKKDGKLSEDDIRLLLEATANSADKVRETAWYSIKLLALHPPAMETVVLRTLKEEANPYCRELALAATCNLPPNAKLFDAVIEVLRDDKDEVVQDRACMTLAGLTRSAGAPKEVQDRSLAELITFFQRFGTGCNRTDKAWGWRECGNALRALGKPGEEALTKFMADPKDRQLADLAWRVLYLKQEDRFCFVTEEEDRIAHERQPFLTLKVGAAGK